MLQSACQRRASAHEKARRGAGWTGSIFQNRAGRAVVVWMKIAWKSITWFAGILIVLIGFGRIPSEIEGWKKMLSPLPDWIGVPVSEIGPPIALVAYLSCAIVTAAICCAYIFAVLSRLPSIYVILKLWAKRCMNMAHFLTVQEAAEVIRASDFWAIKTKSAEHPEGIGHLIKSMGMHQPRKQIILERRFLQKMLQTFSETVPDGWIDGKFNAVLLNKWLDALIDREVEDQMGSIPHVIIDID